MKIQKKFQGTIPDNKIMDTYSPSNTDTYSCNQVNKMNSYSTTEQKIGTWINGKSIYRKVIEVPSSVFTSTYVSYDHNISNLDTVITVKANWYDSQGYCWRSMPSSYHASADWASQILVKSAQIIFEIGSSAYTIIQTKSEKVAVILEYTKTTD